MGGTGIETHPIHLGLGATSSVEPLFTGAMEWYAEYAINEPGTWHTADVQSEATALFVTAGMGTQHRPR